MRGALIRKIGWIVMMVFATIIAAYSIAVLVVPTMRAPFLQQRFMTMPLAATLHLAGAAVALVVGPLQHNSRLHGRFLNMHRSEEHTSELQSQSNLVCRLLVEKKKQAVT